MMRRRGRPASSAEEGRRGQTPCRAWPRGNQPVSQVRRASTAWRTCREIWFRTGGGRRLFLDEQPIGKLRSDRQPGPGYEAVKSLQYVYVAGARVVSRVGVVVGQSATNDVASRHTSSAVAAGSAWWSRVVPPLFRHVRLGS